MQTTRQNSRDDTLDRQSGGLTCEWKRAAMMNRPVLIIGLGGTGIRAMLAAKREIQREIKAPAGAPHPDRLAFLAVDTDEADLDRLCVDGVRVAEDERVLIREPDLPRCLSDPESIAEAYMRDWLSDGISLNEPFTGSAGVRQLGRFQLLRHAQELIEKLQQAIARIWGANGDDGRPLEDKWFHARYHVYLLAGLGGGTGSGILLDVAYIIREIFESRLQRELHLRAMLFLPASDGEWESAERRDAVFANTYAALRELDYWMVPPDDARFRQRYAPEFAVDLQGAPLEWCALLTPEGAALRNSRKSFFRMVGRVLLHLITAGGRDGNIERNFDEFLWYSIFFRGHHAERRRPTLGNCVYASFGMAELWLPLDEATNVIAYHTLRHAHKRLLRAEAEVPLLRPPSYRRIRVCEPHNSALSADELEASFRENFGGKVIRARLFGDGGAEVFGSPVRDLEDFRRAIAGMTPSQVLSVSGGLDGEMQRWLDRCVAGCRAMVDELSDSCAREFVKWLDAESADPDCGPDFVLNAFMRGEKAAIREILDRERDRSAALLSESERRAEHFKAEAVRLLQNDRLMDLSPGRFREYADAVFQQYDELRNLELAKVQKSIYSIFATGLRDWVVSKIRIIKSALRNCDGAVKTPERGEDCDPAEIQLLDYVANAVNGALAESAANVSELSQKLLSSILREPDAWLRDGAGCCERLSRFINDSVWAGNPMEQWFRLVWGAQSEYELKRLLQDKILPELLENSNPLFPLDERVLPRKRLEEIGFVMAYPGIPKVARQINDAIEKYMYGRMIGWSPYDTSAMDSLCWIQGWEDLPLRAHKLLPLYREAHDARGAADQHRGRYLRMSKEENWASELPELL